MRWHPPPSAWSSPFLYCAEPPYRKGRFPAPPLVSVAGSGPLPRTSKTVADGAARAPRHRLAYYVEPPSLEGAEIHDEPRKLRVAAELRGAVDRRDRLPGP